MKEIKTSRSAWLTELSQSYKKKEPVLLVDDAKIGIDPSTETLLIMGRKGKISAREWIAVLISLGVAASGAYLLVMAILDPEPYSKIVAAIGTGAVLIGSGGFMAVRVLTHIKPPNVKMTPQGFEIHWN
jgi:hypothetical protein